MTYPTGPFTGSAEHTHLPTTGEFIEDEHGNFCPVLDTNKISFSNAAPGRKKATTRVVRATGYETTAQEFAGLRESGVYVPQKGEAIFINGPKDMYVPGDEVKGRLKFDDLEAKGYKIVSQTHAGDVQVKSPPALLLVGAVDARVCIKNAWGPSDKKADQQFLSAGATLKTDETGKVTGMDKEAFAKWELDVNPTAKPTRADNYDL